MKDLRLLEFAIALGRHRNFARAARTLYVTQPTLSRGIASLEASLGVRLFDRTTRHVVPTRIGSAFLEHADALLRQAAQLIELAGHQSESLNGHLVVGSGPFPLECSVLIAVARLTRLHPALRIRVTEGAWRDLPGALLSGSVEVAVMEVSVLMDDHRLRVEPLPRHCGCLVCRTGHPLTKLKRVTQEDLEPYPFVGIPITREIGTTIGQPSRMLEVDHASGDLTPLIVTTSLHAMIELVQATDGVGLYPISLLRKESMAGRLAVLDTNLKLPSTGYGIATLRSRTPSAAALAFMQVLREVEQEHVDRQQAVTMPAQARPKGRRQRRRG